jgi:hypothetical protein
MAGSPTDSDPLEDRMAECFALPEEEWEDAVGRLAAAHPEQADEIRERFETVRLLNRAD